MFDLLIYVIVGLIVTFIGTKVLGGEERGLVVNTILGAFGAYTGNLLVGTLGIVGLGLPGVIIIGVMGAFLVHIVVKLFTPTDK